MPSKRSKQHARRRVAKRVAALLMDRREPSDIGGPVYRMVEAKMKAAYTTLNTMLARSMYLSEHE